MTGRPLFDRLVERRESDSEARLAALREAVRVATADSSAGRYKAFESDSHLREHLQGLVDEELNFQRDLDAGRVVDEPARVLEVLRVLHDAMDFPRHIPE